MPLCGRDDLDTCSFWTYQEMVAEAGQTGKTFLLYGFGKTSSAPAAFHK